MAPLLHLREQRREHLAEGSRAALDGRRGARARLRSGLVMAEVALAVVLVVGAGLLLRSFWNLMTVDAGFNRSQLVTFGLVLPARSTRSHRAASISSSGSRPAVRDPRRAVGGGDDRPAAAAAGQRERHRLRGLHRRRPKGRSRTSTTTRPSRADYLTTMGIPIVEGRDFALADVTGGPVVLVNETLAKTFFPRIRARSAGG